MFAIYKNGSVGFRSTADNLYNLKNNLNYGFNKSSRYLLLH